MVASWVEGDLLTGIMSMSRSGSLGRGLCVSAVLGLLPPCAVPLHSRCKGFHASVFRGGHRKPRVSLGLLAAFLGLKRILVGP